MDARSPAPFNSRGCAESGSLSRLCLLGLARSTTLASGTRGKAIAPHRGMAFDPFNGKNLAANNGTRNSKQTCLFEARCDCDDRCDDERAFRANVAIKRGQESGLGCSSRVLIPFKRRPNVHCAEHENNKKKQNGNRLASNALSRLSLESNNWHSLYTA